MKFTAEDGSEWESGGHAPNMSELCIYRTRPPQPSELEKWAEDKFYIPEQYTGVRSQFIRQLLETARSDGFYKAINFADDYANKHDSCGAMKEIVTALKDFAGIK